MAAIGSRYRPRRAWRAGRAISWGDLPPLATLDEGRAIAHPSAAVRGVGDIALDGSSVYAIALEPDGAGVARADLAARKWQWLRADGCAGPQAIAIAVSRSTVVCAAHLKTGVAIRATGKDGS